MLQQKPFILVVEDDGPLLKVLTRYLQAIGYTVLQATSFREAVDRIAIKPNLVILDINLPDGTGWDVADWLQSLTQDVPIVMMSTSARPSPKQLNKVGAKAFLAKPFPIEALLSLVKQYAPLPGDYLDDLSALA
jgi:two-component system, OmpR family, KDP operon response regulator KdpE